MNVAQMREYIKKTYTHLYGRGGVRIPIDKCPDAQIIATYHSMRRREMAKAMSKNVSTVGKDKQHTFNF